ncbi:hypothetical protein AUK22_00700 [bacterium CG2_30_54_10]|nr:MAG: hypothetical protein AUK22_00700 [bacterium CG2_30_54_10]
MLKFRIISIIRGRHESPPEGAKRPTAGDEPREFTSRGQGRRVPPFIEKLQNFVKSFAHEFDREKPYLAEEF